MHLRTTCAIIVCLLTSGAPLFAQPRPGTADALPAGADGATRIRSLVDHVCPDLASQLLASPNMAPILRDRPISVKDVCTCTQVSVSADARLREYFFEAEEDRFQARKSQKQLQAYLATRVIQSQMACLAAEMDRSLAASGPEK